MSETRHERPGVYSAYDASAVVSAGAAPKNIGVAAKAAGGTVGAAVTLTGYAAGVRAFGEDTEAGMSTILKLLFQNGASSVTAVRVADEGTLADYEAAFAVLSGQDVQVVVCDSGEVRVHQALRSAVESDSAVRRERIAVVGGSGETAAERVSHAAEPLNGAELRGLGGLAASYSDNEIDLLVRGGVTPLESESGIIAPVRGITTRTTTGGAADATWRELTTILIVDDIIPAVRGALRSKFARTKNTARNRGAIRSQVIVELEKKVAAEIIDSYGEVTATADPDDPTVCLVEFGFAVAHGLNQIYLTVHITV